MEKKQRYYCQFCTNKKFKTAQYLEEHIKRRHLNYSQHFLKYPNTNKKKNDRIYEQKLNEMKKYFELLINQTIKKANYIRLNEKLNGLQNLMLMMPNQNYQNSNIIYENNNLGIKYNQENIFINEDNFNQNINEEKFKNSNKKSHKEISDTENAEHFFQSNRNTFKPSDSNNSISSSLSIKINKSSHKSKKNSSKNNKVIIN